MKYFVKPYSDIFIKYLFGSEDDKDILLEFINAVLSESDFDRIVDVEIRNPFNIKDFAVDKESILDIKAIDENGRIYNIEVQSSGNEIFINRSLYYWAEIYSGQLSESEIYKKLKPVICINILNMELFDNDRYFNTFLLKEQTTNQILTDHIVLNFIELPKFNGIDKNSNLEKFIYFLKNEGGDSKMLETLIKEDLIIKKAHNKYEKFTGDDKLRELYNSRIKYERDKLTLIDEAEMKGKKEGKIEGIKKGIKKGKIETAKMMLKKGYNIETIAELTGLNIDEIKTIIK